MHQTAFVDFDAMRVGSPVVSAIPGREAGVLVNDVHSKLNATRVASIVQPRNVEDLQHTIAAARSAGQSIAIAGGRHAMGGQQFADGSVLVDTRALARVLTFDRERGTIAVEGGIQWPELLEYLEAAQNTSRPSRPSSPSRPSRPSRPSSPSSPTLWGIYQKQTGADRLSLAGALACNAHGRGLTLKPIVDQIESFDLVGPDGVVCTCSRDRNRDLFRLAIGGYGLFGIISRVVLRLRPRVKVRRVVELAHTPSIVDRFEERVRDGYLYGDFQFATDANLGSFLRRGVFSCYQPVPIDTPLTENPTRFNPEDWARLTLYSHTHKELAFDVYSTRYLATSGQIYWADSQLSAAYVDDYHVDLDHATGATVPGSEMITELYVPPARLADFMAEAAQLLRERDANVIYGTIRLIERDEETFLAWARERYACVIFNLHVDHTPESIAHNADTFRLLIDLAIAHDGNFYLTYHRWARRDQIERCYPQMRAFLALKREYDPHEVFQSTWYRHYRDMMR